MGDDSWDTSDFLQRYASKPMNGNANHVNDEEMNSSVDEVEDDFTPYNEETVFCTSKNLEERLLYLNQELCTLGFPPILDKSSNTTKNTTNNFDVTKLVNCTYELLRTHSRQVKLKDDLEAGRIRMNNDNDILLQTQDRLKHEIETLKNENALSSLREKELTKKCTCLQQDVKTEREEKRKMKSDIDQVRKQFYHESKRLEKEITRLKDKLNQTLSDKSNQTQKVLIDILNPLPRSDGKRSKWSVGTKKIREEEMYKLLIANYEEKEQVLVSENQSMRDTLNEINKSLFHIDPSSSSEVYDEEGKQYQMPFHLVREDVNNRLKNMLALLQKKVESVDGKSKPVPTPPVAREEANETSNEKYKELVCQVEQYKEIISSQEKVLEGMKDGYNEEAFDKLLKMFGTREEEVVEYEDRIKLLRDDIQKYEQDRKEFASYVSLMAKEKEEFDRERVEFYMHRISTPVVTRETKMAPQKGFKSPTASKTPSTPNFVHAPCRSLSKKQKSPSTGELYKYLSLSYDSTSPKKFAGYPIDGSFQEQNKNSSRKVQEHSDKIRKAVEDRQNKSNLGDERRNILSELENVK